MKLIKCSDYVLNMANIKMENCLTVNSQLVNEYYNIVDYANFLKRPLELGMFIPCDKEGNVLEKPKRWNDYHEFPKSFDGNKEEYECIDYEEALDRVLFVDKFFIKGGKDVKEVFKRWAKSNNYQTIEDLTELGLELTPNAINHIK